MRLFICVCAASMGVLLGVSLAGPRPANALDAKATTKPADVTPDEIFRSANKTWRSGDTTSAIKLFEEAADLGHPGALWVLGEHYRHGEGVAPNDMKAFQIFNEIANSHADDSPNSPQAPFVASAFVELGSYYLTGINDSAVKPNVAEARRLLTYAASYFGDREAQFKLGRMLANSALPDHDMVQAARWLTLAARKGHTGAQALLGQLLFAGDSDLPRKPLMGLMWLTIARAHCQTPEDDWIREMQEQAFSVAAEQDRRQAVRLAQEWIAKNTTPQ
jgi:TPR repeat protein